MKNKILLITVLTLLTNIVKSQSDNNFARNYNVKVGQSCPEVAFGITDGSTIKISDYQKSTVLIYFWSAEVDTSVKVLPELMKLQKKYGRFIVIAVNDGKMNRDSLEKFTLEKKLKYPMALDNNQFLYKTLAGGSKYGYPFSLLIDKDGIVEKINTNYKEVEKILERNNILLRLKHKIDNKHSKSN